MLLIKKLVSQLKKKNPLKKYSPELETYLDLGYVWNSFLMFFHPPKFKSKYVNTDELGFRYTTIDGQKYSVNSSKKNLLDFESVSFLVGGSTLFGNGASSDANTIPSLLSKETGRLFLNVAGRMFGSNQQLILFSQIANMYPNLKEVFILSGFNEIFLSRYSKNTNYFGPFYFQNIFNYVMNNFAKDKSSLKYILINYLKKTNNKDLLNPRNIYLLIKKIIKKFSKKQNNKINKKYETDVNAALKQYKKNLFLWKKISKGYQFKFLFILQPVPHWINKEPSNEEKELFEFLDSSPGDSRKIESVTKKSYEKYSKGLSEICKELDIQYYDLNKILIKYIQKNEWIFADRIHLNDNGNKKVTNCLLDIIKNNIKNN